MRTIHAATTLTPAAHALREHGRENVSRAMAQGMIAQAVLATTKTRQQEVAIAQQVAHLLLTLPNDRGQESEADAMGLELMARAGYDPRAAASLWRKMAVAMRGQTPPEYLSTHPDPAHRISNLEALVPRVWPLYLVAAGRVR